MTHPATVKRDLFVSSQNLQRVRRIATRKKFVLPCSQCKTWRRRCDGYRPCSKCIGSATAHFCVNDNGKMQNMVTESDAESAICIQRPLPYMTFKLLFGVQHPMLKISQELEQGWSCGPLRRLWAIGFNHEKSVRLLLGVPSWIRFEIGHALVTVEKISAQQGSEGRENCWAWGQSMMNGKEDVWEGDMAPGLSVVSFDPDTQQRKDVMASSAMADIFGMHREEYLARVANHDLPLPFSDLDALKTLFFSAVKAFFNPGQLSGFIFRMTFSQGSDFACKLISASSIIVKGPDGKVHQVKRAYKVITAEEYDEAVARCPGNCLPYAMGDCRTGCELLASGAEDMRRESIEVLSSTPQGIAMLQQIVTGLLAAGAALAGLAPPMPPPPAARLADCANISDVDISGCTGRWSVAEASGAVCHGGYSTDCDSDVAAARLAYSSGAEGAGECARKSDFGSNDDWLQTARVAVYVPSLPLPEEASQVTQYVQRLEQLSPPSPSLSVSDIESPPPLSPDSVYEFHPAVTSANGYPGDSGADDTGVQKRRWPLQSLCQKSPVAAPAATADGFSSIAASMGIREMLGGEAWQRDDHAGSDIYATAGGDSCGGMEGRGGGGDCGSVEIYEGETDAAYVMCSAAAASTGTGSAQADSWDVCKSLPGPAQPMWVSPLAATTGPAACSPGLHGAGVMWEAEGGLWLSGCAVGAVGDSDVGDAEICTPPSNYPCDCRPLDAGGLSGGPVSHDSAGDCAGGGRGMDLCTVNASRLASEPEAAPPAGLDDSSRMVCGPCDGSDGDGGGRGGVVTSQGAFEGLAMCSQSGYAAEAAAEAAGGGGVWEFQCGNSEVTASIGVGGVGCSDNPFQGDWPF